MTWVVWDSARIWTKGPFSYAILLQLSAKFCSHETPLSLILIETCLYWGFSTNQVVSAAPAPNSKSPCALPPDNQLEDPEGAFDEDEGLLAGAIQWCAIDIHQLITSPHLLRQGCLASIFNLCCRGQKRKQVVRRFLPPNSTSWLLPTSEPQIVLGDGTKTLQGAAKKLIIGHYLLKANLGQALEEENNTDIMQSVPWRNQQSIWGDKYF